MEEDKISMLEALKGNNKDIFIIKIQNIFDVFSYEDYSWIEDGSDRGKSCCKYGERSRSQKHI